MATAEYYGWTPGRAPTSTTAPRAWAWSITSDSTLPMVHKTYTWREAIEYANRIRGAARKPIVQREADMWAVHWRAKPILINGSN